MAGLFFSGCKSDSDVKPTPNPVPVNYTVFYSLSIFGGYDSLELSYFEANNMKRTDSSPKIPWEETFYNYLAIDSVALKVSFLPLPNRTLTYEYEINITRGSEYINGTSFSATIETGENPESVLINFATTAN
ncbi:MAG: hypothetical protein K9H16_10165 [Bacteroidales bacterium]|nr:hypothetical protein [Bacteroidales bacterium]